MKCPAPCSAILRHSPSSWAAVVHWSALILKALRSSRRHPIHSFSWPPMQPAPPTSSPNITLFGSLVSSMRVIIPGTASASCAQSPIIDALTSRLHRRVQIGNWVVGAIILSLTEAASGELGAACRSGTRAGSTWRSRTALSRVPGLLAFEFWARWGALGGSNRSRVYFRKLHHACCVCAGWPQWAGRHCGWHSSRGIRTRWFGFTPGQLPLRWIWRWTPAPPSCVNTWWYISWSISVLASDAVSTMLYCYDVVVVILMASLRKRLGQGREGGGGRRDFQRKRRFPESVVVLRPRASKFASRFQKYYSNWSKWHNSHRSLWGVF